MNENDWLAERFEEHRTHLRAVAYRMLGSLSEADDAVQETWLRLSRADTERRREPRRLADHGHVAGVPQHAAVTPDPARGAARRARARPDRRPARTAATPSTRRCSPTPSASRCSWCSRRSRPAERLAFVLHDMFAVPFDEIAPIVDRSPEATRQLASRARRRVQGARRARRRSGPPARGGRRLLRRGARSATSTRSSRCSTPTSCCAPTPAPNASTGACAVRRPSPAGR